MRTVDQENIAKVALVLGRVIIELLLMWLVADLLAVPGVTFSRVLAARTFLYLAAKAVKTGLA